MEQLEKLLPHTRRAFVLGLSLALAVLATTILAGWLFVRGLVRQQIAQRDAEALHATTLMEQLDARNGNSEPLENDEQIGFDAAILASRLKGVMGIRFFDPGGQFTDAFPASIQPQTLGNGALLAVRQFKPHARFQPATRLTEVFIWRPEFATGSVARVPTLEVTVPLHRRDERKLAGAAQFILEGASIAEEYARLDRHLSLLAALAFAVAGGALAFMLWPAFRQVERLNEQLAQRSERLLRANEELALAARASALGAVSAHLMHGLKNPLASLAEFVHNRREGTGSAPPDEWQDALTAAQRMQALVEQTLEVLADARGGPAYEITAQELAAAACERVAPLARRRGVTLSLEGDAASRLSSRAANLLSLILVNLLENALQATPSGGKVALRVTLEEGRLSLAVRDAGSGFPPHLRARLFLPCKSTRDGGSGIGLAICKQLASYLGADLELVASGPTGCQFVLGLPVAAGQACLRMGPEPDGTAGLGASAQPAGANIGRCRPVGVPARAENSPKPSFSRIFPGTAPWHAACGRDESP
jgi:signal transduction histidine kinase